MLKEKKLYLILSLLMVFALIGEQPNLKGDFKRTSTRLMRSLQVDEVVDGWQTFIGHADSAYRNISSNIGDRLVNRASAATVQAVNHDKPIIDNHHTCPEPKTTQTPWVGLKGKC